MNKDKLRECVSYFKNNIGFHRLFIGIRNRYINLGRIGGSVTLQNLNKQERDALEGFFQKSYRKQKSAVITLEKMQNALDNSKFEGVLLNELMESYFGESLETKREEKDRMKEEQDLFFKQILDLYQSTFSGDWLAFILEDSSNYVNRYLVQKYRERQNDMENIMVPVMNAGNQLPVFRNKKERLAIFSAAITGDPHFFDEGTEGNRLLSYLLEYYTIQSLHKNEGISETEKREKSKQYGMEKKSELFYHGGLLKDDISNYTIIYGIKGIYGDGTYHKGIQGFYQEKQPLQVSLYTLSNIVKIETLYKKVFVVENPAVFAELILPNATNHAFVCTNGQLHLASLVLLDLFYNQGYHIYYAGDFDPEGLQIAQKLKIRYEDQLFFWRYGRKDYENSLSEVVLSEKRLAKLNSVTAKELNDVKEELLSAKRAGYQEKLIEDYKKDLEIC